ncbi:MAG TPA: phosphatidate cytidylyltransferase [Anaerolinea sp.]|nr:phosphatidate cytidylyltransferase [Anaerolinea sp.]
MNKLSSLSQRILVAIVLIPLGVGLIALGGWFYSLFIMLILGIAAWEYWRLFGSGGYQPSAVLLVGGTVAMQLARVVWGVASAEALLALGVMAAMAWQVFSYARSEKTAALDFNINLGGLLYIGWLGSFLISLRNLPDGTWWFMTVLPAIWLADAGAYLVGSRIGRHRMAASISPKKSWEGYIAGIVTGILGTAALAALWHLRAPAVTVEKALVIGAVVSVLSPLGDLGESMLKRGFGVKDTSQILPGHGGIMDRIDSWLWAAPIGYYIITLFF